MSNEQQQATRARFIAYPTHCVVGVIDDPDEAQQVQSELENAAFANTISVLRGPEGAAAIDASGAHHGVLARLVRLVQFTTMDEDHAARYEAEARADHSVMLVHIDDARNVGEVRKTFKAHGGHFINWYDRFTFEVLDD